MSDQRTGLPVRLFDEDNLPYTDNNPLPVSLSESEGDEIHDFLKDVDVVKNGGSEDHDYEVSAGKSFLLYQILCAGSGRAKFDLQVESGVATDVFASKGVAFTSTATLYAEIALVTPIKVAAGVRVRVTKTNLDNNDHDLYSTIIGIEK